MRTAILVSFAAAPLLAQGESLRPGESIEGLRRELSAARAELAELREWTPPVRGSLGVDFTTQYVFRGIPQEDSGFIAQPSVELVFGLTGGNDWLPPIDLVLGTWNSLHSGPTGASPSVWYESDVYVGFAASFDAGLTASTRYTAYHSPNGRFATVQEVSATLAWDDSSLALPVQFAPSLTLAFETAGQADAGEHGGIYAELGIDPSVALGDSGVDLLLPVRVGLSIDGYYEDPTGGSESTFGYVDVGVVLAATAPWLPAVEDGWQVDVGLHWLALGRTNELRNGGDGSELIGTFGISTTF
jgi:hypothetical protein